MPPCSIVPTTVYTGARQSFAVKIITFGSLVIYIEMNGAHTGGRHLGTGLDRDTNISETIGASVEIFVVGRHPLRRRFS